MSVDEDPEVIGHLKVSLEAAKALTGIYQEFHQESETKKEGETDEEDEEEEEEGEEEDDEEDKEKEEKEDEETEDDEQEEKKKDPMQMIDYDDFWKHLVWDGARSVVLHSVQKAIK